MLRCEDRYIYRPTFSPDSQVIAAISNAGIEWWNVATGSHLKTFGSIEDISIVAFSPNTQLLAAAIQEPGGLGRIKLFDATTAKHLALLQGHKGYVVDIIFSPDSQLIAIASKDRTIRIWNGITYTCLHILESPEDLITKIKFSPDGRIIASVSQDKTIRLWNVTTGIQLQMMQYDKGFVREITFLPDELVVSVSDDELNSFWNLWNPMTLKSYSYPITDAHQDTPSNLVSFGVNLDADKTWITKGSEKLVRIPPQYRPTAWARRESTIFFSYGSSQIVRFQV
ncbi:WD40-repeat-containing domain protein, partial [Hypoxylon sp. FL1150]